METVCMTLKIGDKIPMIDFKIIGEDGPQLVSAKDLYTNKKVILFAVPGAFTPTCHNYHVPGFIDNLDILKSKGIDEVGVISVNDIWVMDEWAKATKGKDKILYLSDGGLEFTKAIGMDVDLSANSLGMRSKRYSMIVDNGVVTSLNIEVAPGTTQVSGAAAILSQL